MARIILPPEQLSNEGTHFYEAINGESPLACVLIAGASLEQAVASLLLNHFAVDENNPKPAAESKKLFEIGGALDNFGSCTRLAYCLGLIHENAFENLKTIAKIRNRFAHHHMSMDFGDAQVRGYCASLTLPPFFEMDRPDDPEFKEMWRDARNRFMITVSSLWSRILLSALSEQHRPPCKIPW